MPLDLSWCILSIDWDTSLSSLNINDDLHTNKLTFNVHLTNNLLQREYYADNVAVFSGVGGILKVLM